MAFDTAFPELRQIGQNTFVLLNTVTYTDTRGDGKTYVTTKNLVTDRASIPSLLWSLVSPFGRQTRAALIHDTECNKAIVDKPPGVDVRTRDRRLIRENADGLFFRMLVDDGVPRFRAAVMWSFVTIHRYVVHARVAFVALLAVWLLAGFGALGFGVWRLVVDRDASAWPLLLAPLVLALPWARGGWRSGRALVLAPYAGILVAPFVIVTLATWVVLGLLNAIGWMKPAPLDANELAITGHKPSGLSNIVTPKALRR